MNKNVYGHFAVHVGRGIYRGIWVGLGHKSRPGAGSQVRWMVVRQDGGWTLAGLALGGALSLALAPVASALLFQVGPRDLGTFGGAATFLLAVTALASYVAARAVDGIAPLAALRRD